MTNLPDSVPVPLGVVKQFLIPTRYALPWTRLKNGEPWMRAEIVARNFGPNGRPTTWAIQELGCVLARDGLWEYEPSPSNRDEDFIQRTRFDSLDAAVEFAESHFTKGEAR